MRQARYVVVALRRYKYLGFVFEPAEGVGKYDAVTVALESGSQRAGLLCGHPAAAGITARRVGRQALFGLLQPLPDR
jgi:hypothetical protein